MPIPEISYVLVTSWYGFTCGNLILPGISWATPQFVRIPVSGVGIASLRTRRMPREPRWHGASGSRGRLPGRCPRRGRAGSVAKGVTLARGRALLRSRFLRSGPPARTSGVQRGVPWELSVLAVVVVRVVLLAGPPVAAGDQLGDRD